MLFQDETFDVVSDHNTFSYLVHIKQEKSKALGILKEMHRVLKPGGYIYPDSLDCLANGSLAEILSFLGYENMNEDRKWHDFIYRKPI